MSVWRRGLARRHGTGVGGMAAVWWSAKGGSRVRAARAAWPFWGDSAFPRTLFGHPKSPSRYYLGDESSRPAWGVGPGRRALGTAGLFWVFFPRRTSVPRLERIAKARRRSRFGVREREEGVLRQKRGKRREDAITSRAVPSRPSGSFQHGGRVVLPEAAVNLSSLLFPRPRVPGALGIQSVFLQPTWVWPVAAVDPVAHPVLLHPRQHKQAGAERTLKGRNLCLNHIPQCTGKKLKRGPRWLPVALRCKAQRVGGRRHPPTHPPTHPPRGCLPIPGLPLGGVRRLTRSGVSGAAPGRPPFGPVCATVHA